MSLPIGEVLRVLADNEDVVVLLAKALANGLTREEAIQAIEAAMTTASRERMLRELPP